MSETASNPDEVYRAIGRFIFEFSQVEFTIRHYLAERIGLKDEHFMPVVVSFDVAVLCNVTKAVFAQGRADESTRIKKGINRFFDLIQNRNRVVHGLWAHSEEGGVVHHVPRSLKPDRLDNQAGELEKCADELNALRAELESAFAAYLYQPDFSTTSR